MCYLDSYISNFILCLFCFQDLTTDRGELQCDDDDYGYESKRSQEIFEKLANQYSEMPEDERLKFNKVKSGDINDIKVRVLATSQIY